MYQDGSVQIQAPLFDAFPKLLKADKVQAAGSNGALFGGLALSIVIAQLCLRSRVWANIPFIWVDELEMDLHKAIVELVDVATVPSH